MDHNVEGNDGPVLENGLTVNHHEEPADFEKAISASGWGKFNLILYAISISSGWTSVLETTVMSYVFPAAECDLDLKLEHKGLLNSATYIGMISSGFLWGFLCDTLGRKKLLVAGYLLDAVFVFLGAASQNFAMLITAKFFGGFIINGPFTALNVYLSEIHCTRHRARVQMVLGTIFSMATLVLPILAVLIMPLDFKIEINQYFSIHPWNLYIFICGLIPLFSGIGFMFLPESPKFLMTIGNNEKALKVFKRIYRLNTGNNEETYPIKSLLDEIEMNKDQKYGKITANRSKKEAIFEGFSQIKPLFLPPYLGKLLLICLIQFFAIMSLNSLRLWLPQIFQAINDYEQTHNETASLCDMMEVFKQTNGSATNSTKECFVNTNNYSVYTNSIIVAVVSLFAYGLIGMVVNKIGKKRLLWFSGTCAGISGGAMYFSRSILTTVALSSLFTAWGGVMVHLMLSVVVDIFSTNLRAISISVVMVCGRIGASVGNVIFPYLLKMGCAPVFIYTGGTIIVFSLFVWLIPHSDNEDIK